MNVIARHPLLSFLVLCYGISWMVWLAIPLVAEDWTVMKIFVGAGMGPGLAHTGSLLLAMALHTAINNSGRILPGASMYPVLLIVVIIAIVAVERMWRGGRVAVNAEPVAA
ncbi:MAG TPA: hypothetical protein VND45_02990 [Thermoanaerobaculia bacterium]|nr:hypothetical protein [Thermoanaerobaculia bacterium]